jgi:hypothetical protein
MTIIPPEVESLEEYERLAQKVLASHQAKMTAEMDSNEDF